MPKSSKASARGEKSTASPIRKQSYRTAPNIPLPPSQQARSLMPVKIAAQRLGLSVWGLRAMAYQGRVSSHKIGARLMFANDEIERIIAESERPRIA